MGDERILRMTELLKLRKKDIAKMWTVFKTLDADRIGVVTMVDVSEKIMLCERNMFGDSIFELIDAEDKEKIEFGEFVQGICTYCMFEPSEILKFCFFIFDKDKNGYIDQDEMNMFIYSLHQNSVGGNIQNAVEGLDANKDGHFEFSEFKRMHKLYPQVLYPAFRMQTNIQQKILGEWWWKRKKSALAFQKEMKELEEKRVASQAERELERARQNQIKKHMGSLKYYLMPHKRTAYDDMFPPPT